MKLPFASGDGGDHFKKRNFQILPPQEKFARAVVVLIYFADRRSKKIELDIHEFNFIYLNIYGHVCFCGFTLS